MTTSNSQCSADESVQQLVLMIAQSLVDESDAVTVECFEEGGAITLNLHVANEDAGKIIGKQGRTARSIRTIISAAGMKLRRRYALNIEEDYNTPKLRSQQPSA